MTQLNEKELQLVELLSNECNIGEGNQQKMV